MNFENYTSRITSLTNFDSLEKPPADYKEVSRLTVFQGEMQKKNALKQNVLKFSRFFFSLMELLPYPCPIPI